MQKTDLLELISVDKTHEELCSTLAHLGDALKTAAHDYAEGALKVSDIAYEAAVNAGPVIEVWQYLQDHDKYAQRAMYCMQNARSAYTLLLRLEETLEVDIDSANADWKESVLDEDTMNARLLASGARINVCRAAIPDMATPRSRCTPPKQKHDDGTDS